MDEASDEDDEDRALAPAHSTHLVSVCVFMHSNARVVRGVLRLGVLCLQRLSRALSVMGGVRESLGGVCILREWGRGCGASDL